MRIAVTYEDEQVYPHFGHTAQFKIFDITDGSVSGAEVLDTNGSGHGALADFLAERGVNVLICGGIGGCARTALSQAGIRLCAGVSGDVDEAVTAFLDGTLVCSQNPTCSHSHGHNCAHHGCR